MRKFLLAVSKHFYGTMLRWSCGDMILGKLYMLVACKKANDQILTDNIFCKHISCSNVLWNIHCKVHSCGLAPALSQATRGKIEWVLKVSLVEIESQDHKLHKYERIIGVIEQSSRAFAFKKTRLKEGSLETSFAKFWRSTKFNCFHFSNCIIIHMSPIISNFQTFGRMSERLQN